MQSRSEPRSPDTEVQVPAAGPAADPAIRHLCDGNEHPMLPVGYEILVNERRLEGHALSLAGGTCKGLLDPSLDRTRCLAMLHFSFEGFVLGLPAEIVLRVLNGPEQGAVTFVFADPAGAHLPQLRFVLNSFIAGDLVQIGDLLQVNTQTRVSRARPQARRGVRHALRQAVRYTILAGLSAGLLALTVSTLHSRVLTRLDPNPAVIVSSGTVLRAPSAGQIDFVNADAGAGDVAFSLLSINGALLSIRMPCDCGIGEIAAAEGATILAGEPVMTLRSADATPRIRAQLSPETLQAVLAGDRIELVFADGTILGAEPGPAVGAEVSGARPGDPAPVTLVPTSDLPATRIGELARLRVVRAMPLLTRTIHSIQALFTG